MASIINNRGENVMTSLMTRAAIADGLTEDQLNQIAKLQKKQTVDTQLRLGCFIGRVPDETPVFLAEDLTANSIPRHAEKINFARFPMENCESLLIWNKKYRQMGDRLAEVEAMTNLVRSKVHNISLLIIAHRDHKIAMQFYPLRSGKLALQVNTTFFMLLRKENIDFSSVKKIIMESKLPNYKSILPFLESVELRIPPPSQFDWVTLLHLRNTLRELRITIHRAVSDDGMLFALGQLPQLELLSIECRSPGLLLDQYNLDLLVLSPSLRSLSLLGTFTFGADHIIGFLSKEMVYRGVIVSRERLLDDLTIVGAPSEEVEKIYASFVLTQRMKDRIYSDIDVGHLTAMLSIYSKRVGSSLNDVLRLVKCEWISELPKFQERPHPKLVLVICDYLNHSQSAQSAGQGIDLLTKLFDGDCIGRYETPILRSALAAIISHIEHIKFNTKKHDVNQKDITKISRLVCSLDRCGAIPTNLGDYLRGILTWMEHPWQEDGVDVWPAILSKRSAKLSKYQLEKFFEANKALLVRCFLREVLDYHCDSRFSRVSTILLDYTRDLSPDIVDFARLALLHAKDDEVRTAANALLRRSADGPVPGSWCTPLTREEEEEALRTAFFG